jgi:hypothetical protein
MTSRRRLRLKHLRDFSRRGDVGDILRFRDSEYIPLHPFADDDALLERIGWQSENCTTVAAYWKIYEDVVLIEVTTHATEPSPVGRYARWRAPRGGVSLCVVVDAPAITRATFEDELAKLIDSGALGKAIGRGGFLGEALVPI